MSTLDRRTLLRGLGAGLALPWLEAMAANTAAPTPRLAFVYAPNGVHVERWTPAGDAAALELSPTLAPLSGHAADVTVLEGLTLDAARAHGDGPGDHARSAAAFLTTAHPSKTGPVRAGRSVDQLAAEHLGRDTRLRSLELGCEHGRRAGECDSGYSCVYSSEISWTGPTTPAAKEVDPRLAFERLFAVEGVGLAPEARARLRADRASVLDFVREDTRRLEARLGTSDRAKLDSYLSGVRELERRLVRAASEGDGGELPEGPPPGVPADRGEHARLLADVIALAFEGDLTRVATLMLANEGSNRSHPELEAPEGHHTLSHHGGDADKLAKIARIDRFHVELFAHLVGRLASTEVADGRLLDSTLLVYGSGIADGNRHAHHDLPILVAGGSALGLAGGRVLRFERETPLANLYTSLLLAARVDAGPFGDASGELEGLLDA